MRCMCGTAIASSVESARSRCCLSGLQSLRRMRRVAEFGPLAITGMATQSPTTARTWLRKLRFGGFCLFAVSFLLPSRMDDLRFFGGLGAFFNTPLTGGELLMDG